MPMKVKVLSWKTVGYWNWGVNEDCCGICRMEFEACCSSCKVPGDDCPPVWGKCNHAFHMHCILKWLESQQGAQQQCPMCRADWAFRGSNDQDDTPVVDVEEDAIDMAQSTENSVMDD